MTDIADLLLRGAALGQLLLLPVHFLRRLGLSRKVIALICFNAGLASYLIVSSPVVAEAVGTLRRPLEIIATVNPVLFAWVCFEIFDEDFAPRPIHLIAAALLVAVALTADVAPLIAMARGPLVLALYCYVLVVILRTAAGDLVEPRRRFRVWFFAVALAAGLVITAVEILTPEGGVAPWVFLLQSAAFFALVAAFGLWLVSFGGEIWPADTTPRQAAAMSPADAAIKQRLDAVMGDGAWREEGLTIAGLASLVETPEHRLRKVINGGLGHRNFSHFLNQYRVAEACRLLAETGRADRKVIEIAYETGFGSLGPFNRAFKAVTGESPSEYRKRMTGAD